MARGNYKVKIYDDLSKKEKEIYDATNAFCEAVDTLEVAAETIADARKAASKIRKLLLKN